MRKLVIYPYILTLSAFLFACETQPSPPSHLPRVQARYETEPVEAVNGEDAADDPAIWVHPSDPAQSRIMGSNKVKGIEVYDLQGKRRFAYPVGKVNNIDIRYGFPVNDSTRVDILGGSERTHNRILIFGIDSLGALTPLGPGIDTQLPEVYGFCLYRQPDDSQYYAFINDKSGKIEQWRLTVSGENAIGGELVRTLAVASQPEGMVADDDAGKLYVGEEGRGIWVFDARPEGEPSGTLLPLSGEDNPEIAYDIEGLAIYRGQHRHYLLASSQGNHSYAVFDIQQGYRYAGSFCVGQGEWDGTEETDGIEVSAAPLGKDFRQGLFVAQDGYNYGAEGAPAPQNFKLVSWEAIQVLLGPGQQAHKEEPEH